MTGVRWLGTRRDRAVDRLDSLLGGRARRQVVVVLTCVLALALADQGSLSAVAGAVQDDFGISKAQFGALGSATTGVSAVATLPFGMYVDRADRSRLLGWTTLVWVAAMVASAAATSYLFLIVARVFLGVVVAVAYPAVASLVGDYFPSDERGKIYSYVLAGELLGIGIGIIVASIAASLFGTWRAAMLVLSVPALGVAWLVFRLPEPARGGPSRMPPGQDVILSADRVGDRAPDQTAAGTGADAEDLAQEEVHEQHVQPHDRLVLQRPAATLPLAAAVRYILRVRTNVIVIVASALGYFFFAGFRFFGVQWIQQHYGVARGTASVLLLVVGIFAIAGLQAGGRTADTLLRRGHIPARIVVPAVTLPVSALLFAPGIATTSLVLALALLLPGAFVFAASNPPLDAARLDVMPAGLWGRAESVRSVCRGAFEALAPFTFGLVADRVFGGGHDGLTLTFLVMLTPLVVSGLILLVARRTYPRDVATAEASERVPAGEH